MIFDGTLNFFDEHKLAVDIYKNLQFSLLGRSPNTYVQVYNDE